MQVDDAEVSQHLQALDQPPPRGKALVRVMQERGLSRHDVRAWLRDYLIVRAFIDRRVRLLVRIPNNQIVQYYQDHQQAIGEPLDDAVREQIGCVLTERQVNRRLTELLAERSGRKVSLISHHDLSACTAHQVAWSDARGRCPSERGLLDPAEILGLEVFNPIADRLRVLGRFVLGQIDTLGLADDFFGDEDRRLHP